MSSGERLRLVDVDKMLPVAVLRNLKQHRRALLQQAEDTGKTLCWLQKKTDGNLIARLSAVLRQSHHYPERFRLETVYGTRAED